MIICPECGESVCDDETEYECPYCGKEDYGEGFYTCENCGAHVDYNGEIWECPFCYNNGESESSYDDDRCPECGEELEGENYCFNCGWPDNQGWIGENYG